MARKTYDVRVDIKEPKKVRVKAENISEAREKAFKRVAKKGNFKFEAVCVDENTPFYPF